MVKLVLIASMFAASFGAGIVLEHRGNAEASIAREPKLPPLGIARCVYCLGGRCARGTYGYAECVLTTTGCKNQGPECEVSY